VLTITVQRKGFLFWSATGESDENPYLVPLVSRSTRRAVIRRMLWWFDHVGPYRVVEHCDWTSS
jgi:hypothetical protein